MRDSVTLETVTVTGKSKTQRLREGALAVNAVDVRSLVSSISSLSGLIDRTAGVKIREEGGVGSDFDLSINGMSGNAVRYFVDGVPLDTKGSGVTLANLPVSMIDHVEIYKGVVPTWLSSDALGGAINIVTHRKRTNYLDASYGAGSYHTHKGDISGQLVLKNGLTIRPSLSMDLSNNMDRTFNYAYRYSNADYREHNSVGAGMARYMTLTNDNVITYARDIEKHSFSVMAGETMQQYDYYSVSA
jgi:outer membrane cobalamin receptor